MIREEQITNAARDYVGGIVFSSPSDVLHFTAGAKWADEHPQNVWHDASEEPTDDLAQILYQDYCFNNCWLTTKRDSTIIEGDWKRFAALNLMIRWAYIRDLLPKGGEK